MIFIEVCYINGLDEQNINLTKCILKIRQAKAFVGSTISIRINPSYARTLEQLGLIIKDEENKNYVQLTEKGKNLQIFDDLIELSLEEYFIHENNIEELIEKSMHVAVPKASFKIMHQTCHSCGKSKTRLNHIVDKTTDGMYCNYCLNTIGFIESQTNANNRRKEAQDAFSIRQN